MSYTAPDFADSVVQSLQRKGYEVVGGPQDPTPGVPGPIDEETPYCWKNGDRCGPERDDELAAWADALDDALGLTR